jgi:hypothetical protein
VDKKPDPIIRQMLIDKGIIEQDEQISAIEAQILFRGMLNLEKIISKAKNLTKKQTDNK